MPAPLAIKEDPTIKTMTMTIGMHLLISLLAAAAVSGFAPHGSSININKSRSVAGSPGRALHHMAAVDDAVAIYQKSHPAKGPRKQSPFISAGMPVADIDGTRFKTPKGGRMAGKSFADRDEKYLRAGFTELSKVYGKEEALKMVRDLPIALAFNRKNFAPSLKAFAAKFGNDEAREMVQRNPGLLALKPSGAGGADSVEDQTMKFSYLVAATRPAGPFLLYGLLSLLCEPALEKLTGFPLKESILALL